MQETPTLSIHVYKSVMQWDTRKFESSENDVGVDQFGLWQGPVIDAGLQERIVGRRVYGNSLGIHEIQSLQSLSEAALIT